MKFSHRISNQPIAIYQDTLYGIYMDMSRMIGIFSIMFECFDGGFYSIIFTGRTACFYEKRVD